jgi:hypothetical protein
MMSNDVNVIFFSLVTPLLYCVSSFIHFIPSPLFPPICVCCISQLINIIIVHPSHRVIMSSLESEVFAFCAPLLQVDAASLQRPQLSLPAECVRYIESICFRLLQSSDLNTSTPKSLSSPTTTSLLNTPASRLLSSAPLIVFKLISLLGHCHDKANGIVAATSVADTNRSIGAFEWNRYAPLFAPLADGATAPLLFELLCDYQDHLAALVSDYLPQMDYRHVD